MNVFIKSSMDTYISDLHLKIEVYNVVRDMVDDVENWDAENNLRKAQRNLASTQKLAETIIVQMKRMQEKNKAMGLELSTLKMKAGNTRDLFVRDIGAFLSENKQMKRLKDKINDLEAKLQHMSLYGYEQESESAKERPADNAEEQENGQSTTQSEELVQGTEITGTLAVAPPISEQQIFLYDMDDETLMNVFSYLVTEEVIHSAQVCKYMLKKVYILFSIESTMVLPEWGDRPDRKALLEKAARASTAPALSAAPDRSAVSTATNSVPNTPSRNSVNNTSNGNISAALGGPPAGSEATSHEPALTKEIIGVLIKKLTCRFLLSIWRIFVVFSYYYLMTPITFSQSNLLRFVCSL